MSMTRLDVENEIKKFKNKGKNKIKQDLKAVMKAYPDMTDEKIQQVIDDLESYRDYRNEK